MNSSSRGGIVPFCCPNIAGLRAVLVFNQKNSDPPVYTALTRNSTVTINTTDSDITIQLYEEFEGNYSCVATGKYGVDAEEFSVIFNGKIPRQ